MKAAILAAQGKPLAIDPVQLPRNLSLGQGRVRVHHTSVCGSQVTMINRKREKAPIYLSHLPGHEGLVTIEAVDLGIVEMDGESITCLIKKPQNPPTNLVRLY